MYPNHLRDLLTMDYVTTNPDVFDINKELYIACSKGDVEEASLMIQRGAWAFEQCIFVACRENHIKVVELLINRGVCRYNECFYIACAKGHIEMITLILNYKVTGISTGLNYACQYGHMNIINMISIRRIDDFNQALYYALYYACLGGHQDIVNLLVSKGSNNFNDGLFGACKGNHFNLAKLMISNGASNLKWCIPKANLHSCKKIVNLLIKNQSEIDQHDLEKLQTKSFLRVIVYNNIIDSHPKKIKIHDYILSRLRSDSLTLIDTDIQHLLKDYAMKNLWRPITDRHMLFPKKIREQIFYFLLSMKKIKVKIFPKPLLYVIINRFILD